jgi:cupin fold WbuC family metalloprotein
MIRINSGLIRELTNKSLQSPRKRVNLNFHENANDPIQRMLNSMQPGTYLQPHKHENPDKREVFIALIGRFVVIRFHEDGSVAEHMILDPAIGEFAAEIGPRIYHTIICLTPNSVIYELKDGPYDPYNDKNFASWAPKEEEPECREYLQNLLAMLNISEQK